MAMKLPSADEMMKSAHVIYSNVTGDLPIVGSAIDLANEYMEGDGSIDEKVDRLIRRQTMKSAATGFVAGLPGGLSMAVSIPADIAAMFYIQLRMCAAIAYMYGNEVDSELVRNLAICCLIGDKATEVLKEVGVTVAKNMARNAIKGISKETIIAINKAVGTKLITKFGGSGILNLSKAVPVLGGVVGAGIDATSTYAVGKTAKTFFS